MDIVFKLLIAISESIWGNGGWDVLPHTRFSNVVPQNKTSS